MRFFGSQQTALLEKLHLSKTDNARIWPDSFGFELSLLKLNSNISPTAYTYIEKHVIESSNVSWKNTSKNWTKYFKILKKIDKKFEN